MKRTRWTTVITLLLVVTAGSLATLGTAAPIGQRQARAASLSGSNLLANPDFATLVLLSAIVDNSASLP
jgi:hypothetical protein